VQGNTFVLQILILFPRFFGVLFSFLQFDLAMVNTEECVVRLQGGVMCKETWVFLQILIFFPTFFFRPFFSLLQLDLAMGVAEECAVQLQEDLTRFQSLLLVDAAEVCVLWSSTTHCTTLQHTATQCNTLEYKGT